MSPPLGSRCSPGCSCGLHRQRYCSPGCPCLRHQPRSAETRAKLSVAKRGHPVSAEAREKIGAASRGLKRSPETLARMSAAHLGEQYRRRRYSPMPTRGGRTGRLTTT